MRQRLRPAASPCQCATHEAPSRAEVLGRPFQLVVRGWRLPCEASASAMTLSNDSCRPGPGGHERLLHGREARLTEAWMSGSFGERRTAAVGRQRAPSRQIGIPETGRSDRTARQRTFATARNRPSAVAAERQLPGSHTLGPEAAMLDAAFVPLQPRSREGGSNSRRTPNKDEQLRSAPQANCGAGAGAGAGADYG